MLDRILVPLDGSKLAESALKTAAEIGEAVGAKIDLLMVHVPGAFAGYENRAGVAVTTSIEHRYLRGLAETLPAGLRQSVETFVVTGEPVAKICAHAKRLGDDLIVMTTHGRTGFSRAWIGSVADGIVRESAAPVLMLRASETGALPVPPLRHVLVALDGSAMAEDILKPACALAAATGARVTLAQVVPPVPVVVANEVAPYAWPGYAVDELATEKVSQGANQYLTSVAAKFECEGDEKPLLVGRFGVAVIVNDQPARALADLAEKIDADAIAMTTRGRGASRLIVGSVADKVLRGTTVPLLLYRPSLRRGKGRPRTRSGQSRARTDKQRA